MVTNIPTDKRKTLVMDVQGTQDNLLNFPPADDTLRRQIKLKVREGYCVYIKCATISKLPKCLGNDLLIRSIEDGLARWSLENFGTIFPLWTKRETHCDRYKNNTRTR